MRLNPFAPKDNPLYDSLYCFGGGDDGGSGGGSAGDFEGTNFGGDTATAGGNLSGRGGSQDNDRRVDSRGNTTNFNIDRSQPSVTGTVNGRTTTMYGTQENLDKAIAGGDINVTPSPSDTYTPGTDKAASAFGAAAQDSPFMPDPGATPGTMAAAGPALADTNIFTPTATTAGFSPVARAMTPFERTLAAASRPQTGREQLADLARTDRRAALEQFLETNPNQTLSYANTYLDSLVRADDAMALPEQRQNMSPVDAVNIFEQFEQPIGANNPPTARDPSRPMTEIRAATPAEQITQEARAAANQLLGPGRSRPTAAEIAAAENRLGLTTPQGMTEAEYAAGLGASIGAPEVGAYGSTQQSLADQAMGMSQYGIASPGMQPTTTEVDAYNAAINAEIADQLGVDVYNPVTYGATGPISQVSTGPITQQDYANLAAGRGAIQGDMGVINQAAQEVALETGVSPQVAAQATGIVGANPQLSSTVLGTGSAYPSGQTPDTGATLRAEENAARMQAEMAADQQLTGASGAATEILGGYDRAMAEQRALANRDQMAAEMAADQRGPGAIPSRAGLNDIERAVAEEEAFRASQAEQATRAAAPGTEEPFVGEEIFAPTYDAADLAEAKANLEAAKAEAYRDKQFGLDTGLPSSIDVFGARIPTGVGMIEGAADALFDPEASLANAIAERGIKSVDGASAEGSANYNPQGLEMVTSDGRTVAYDAEGNIVYDTRGIGGQFADLLTFNRPPENIQALYDRQRTIEEQQREMQGGDGSSAPILPPIQETPVEETPEEYQGRDVIKPYQYQPRGPLSYAYTGLPSLAPTRLRPSYTAKKSFSPLFPVS